MVFGLVGFNFKFLAFVILCVFFCQLGTDNVLGYFVFLCLRRRLDTEGIVFALSVRECVRGKFASVTSYNANCSWEFHHIYSLGAFGDKDELVRFLGHTVKGQGHTAIPNMVK